LKPRRVKLFQAISIVEGRTQMIKKGGAVPGALLAAFAGTLFTSALAVHAQSTSGTIQMVNFVAGVDRGVDSKKAEPGDVFTAKTVEGTTLNDGTTVPAGSVLEGHVDSATASEHKSDGKLVLTIDRLQVKGGKEIPVKATITQVASFEHAIGAGNGQPQDRAFDTSARDSARMNGADNAQSAPSGPHDVPGLKLTSSVDDPNSGTLTQAKGNVHLSNENQIQVSVVVIPAGANVR
jgi:hypothetical protein